MIFAPSYYTDFKCTAGACSHSCCIAWEIDIDKTAYKKYKRLKCDVGKRIIDSIDNTDTPHFVLAEDGRCPHLNKDGLCNIIISLGEDYLCDICREHPRFYNHFYSDGRPRCEVGVGAACESAARLILTSDAYAELVAIDVPCTKAKCDKPKGIDILAERQKIYTRLNNGDMPSQDKIAEIAEEYGVSPRRLSTENIYNLYSSLEYLDEESKDFFLRAHKSRPRLTAEGDELVKRYFAYLIYRYIAKSRSARELSTYVAMCAMLAELFSGCLGDNLGIEAAVRSAVRVSEEIEYNPDNIDIIRFYLDTYGRE